METLEVTASDIEEARQKGAQKLGVDPSEVETEVLEESDGLFGKKKLRVRVSAAASSSKNEEPVQAKAVVETRREEPEPEDAPEVAEDEADDDDVDEPAEVESKKPAKRAEKDSGGEKDARSREDAVATQEDADDLAAVLTEVIEAGGFEAEVKQDGLNGKYVNLSVHGADANKLVGENGETLNALQFYMNVVAMRQLDNGVRVVLDADGYRDRRGSALETLAKEVADMVKQRGEEAVLDPLPAFERRVIHNVLIDVKGITTYSEGAEPDRRVVIAPDD